MFIVLGEQLFHQTILIYLHHVKLTIIFLKKIEMGNLLDFNVENCFHRSILKCVLVALNVFLN
jgi:hypothetical protein